MLAEQEDFLRTLVHQIVQQVLEAEMEEAIGAEKGERAPNRLGYRSGYYYRTLMRRVGKLELRVPQGRQGRFRTEVFERYQRSEKALVGALAETYVQGVSTHVGLRKAIREVLSEALWQRCYVHFPRNALDYLPRKADDDCLMELRWIYERRNRDEARQHLSAWLMKWSARYPKLCSSARDRSRRNALYLFSDATPG
jgi:transposase-like protein